MKKRVVMLSSGNTIPLEKEEYDKAQLALQRNTGRNIVMNDGGIIRTVNIEYVGIVDDEKKAPADAIEQIDNLNTEITEAKKEYTEQVNAYKKQAEKALENELVVKEQTTELKKLKKSNENLLEKLGIAEANLKTEKSRTGTGTAKK